MDDPNNTMKEYIRLEEEKARKRGKVFNWKPLSMERSGMMKTFTTSDMATLPPRDQRHLWLRYQVKGYTEEIVHNFEQRLETMFGRQVNRVHILDFKGLTLDIRPDLAERMRMVYNRDDGQEVFVSHEWRRLFEIRAPLVQEFILEFFSTCRIRDDMGLDVYISAEEMVVDGFGAYWLGSERLIPDKAPKKVTATDLFYLRSMDRRVANVPCLLSQYLFRHAEGRKIGARLSGCHFIGRLAHHFGLVSDDGLRELSVVARELPLIDTGNLVKLNIYIDLGDDWAWVATRLERQQVAAAGAPEAAEDVHVADEGGQAVSTPVQAPQQPLPPPLATVMTMP
nr:hypothetical protein [Tanacetum cinerariifolium]